MQPLVRHHSSNRSIAERQGRITISTRRIPKIRDFLTMAARLGLVCLPAVLLGAFLVASFLSVINIDDDKVAQSYRSRVNSDQIQSDSSHETRTSDTVEPKSATPLSGQTQERMTDKPDHLMWFLHLSDLHLSMYFDPKRTSDLKRFCTEVVDAVKPDVIVATGDLTDARNRNPMGSDQHQQEWILYHQVLNESGVLNKVPWLDVRGNHDNFNVLNWESKNNFYRQYSPTGGKHSASYETTINPPRVDSHGKSSKYTFIGIDACLTPGPRRPFNFIGVLNETEIHRIAAMGHKSEHDSEYTIWFGHYPTSSIASPHPGIRSIIRGPYLSGHFHTFMGLVPDMYATHTGAFLEAEVGDWKDLRRFRLATVDHSMFSFIDTALDRWPIIAITNPKRARDALPDIEPLNLIRTSTHLRALIFSPHAIVSAQASIDDGPWQEMTPSQEKSDVPLWTLPWDPAKYSKGLHLVRVRATDLAGNTELVENDFSLDGSRRDFSWGAKFLLRWHKRSFAMTIFISAVILALIPLVALRFALHMDYHRFLRVKSEYSFSSRMLLKYYLLAASNRTFWPLIFVPLYATCGPWFIGEVAEGNFGWFFAWGIMFGSSYLPGGFTYLLGGFQLILFHIPLTLLAANLIYQRYCTLEAASHPTAANRLEQSSHCLSYTYRGILHLLWWLVYGMSVLFSLNYYYAYGWLALLTGVFVSWPSVIYLWVWYAATSASKEQFPEAFRARLSSRGQQQQQGAEMTPKRELLTSG